MKGSIGRNTERYRHLAAYAALIKRPCKQRTAAKEILPLCPEKKKENRHG